MNECKIKPPAEPGGDVNVRRRSFSRSPNALILAHKKFKANMREKKMGKSFGKITGFTPLFDEMIEKYGRNCAAVYGHFWRRSQGASRCFEALDNIAGDLGMSLNTVRKHRDVLLDAGELYVEKREGFTDRYSCIPFDTPTKIGRGTPTKIGRPPLPKLVDEDTTEETKLINKKKEIKNNNNSSVIVIDLINFGIHEKKAKKLHKDSDEKHVIESLEYCELHNYGPGALINCIEEKWDLSKPKTKRQETDIEHGKRITNSWTFDD